MVSQQILVGTHFVSPIGSRIARPSPHEIRAARKAAGLTQDQATALVSEAQGPSAYRVWQSWETPVGQQNHRPIPLLAWEMFLLLTDQHPTIRLTRKRQATAS
jgi:hypothetical protein